MDTNKKEYTADRIVNIVLWLSVILIGGFTNMYLWNNIIAELFEIRTLNFAQAIAFDLVVSYFVYQYKKDDREYREKLIDALGVTLSGLIIGFILTFFI